MKSNLNLRRFSGIGFLSSDESVKSSEDLIAICCES